MQTPTQARLRERVNQIIGNPILVPVSRSGHPQSSNDEIIRFDPHAVPDELLSNDVATSLSILKREIATRTSEDITRGLKELFSEGAEELPVCKPFVRAFVSTRLENVCMAAELPCGSWECKKCGPKLKLKWYLRHINFVAEVPFMEKIFIDRDEWQAYHRTINRQGEKYLKYEQHNGRILLLTTARLGGQKIDIQDREFELVQALMKTAFTRQPVSQSRNWDEKKIEREEQQDTNWQPLDSLRFTDLDSLYTALKYGGIEAAPHSIYSRTYGSMRALTFRIPDGKFWNTLWSLGALARHHPTNGPKERRDTLWKWDSSGV